MKQASLALLLILTFLIASCSKKEEVDPREQYVGEYAMHSARVQRTGTKVDNDIIEWTLKVSKASSADELTFSDGSDTYTVRLNGSSFTINKFVVLLQQNNAILGFDVTGDGSFNGKKVNLSQLMTGINITVTLSSIGEKP